MVIFSKENAFWVKYTRVWLILGKFSHFKDLYMVIFRKENAFWVKLGSFS